ncbi:MAG: ABC transporter ATP-binding protein [Firmicutes bacterium]|nr:ABC transporter ATP-binding protein [Bacillota bacterium]
MSKNNSKSNKKKRRNKKNTQAVKNTQTVKNTSENEQKAKPADKPAVKSKSSDDVAIKLSHVTKQFKLFKSQKSRLKSLFSKKVNYTIKTANEDVSFVIHKGEAVAFFGKNGAGKSTLLKMITGVLFPTEGEIEVNGEVSALLELTAGFDPEFTGRENVYLRGHMRGMSDDKIKGYEQAIVEFADIGEYIDQPVRTYSSGMRARLGFAINANIEPEILIVDEALSVGDAAFRKKCNTIVKKIIAEENTTLLLVTHSSEMARQFCERGIVLHQSKVYFDGPIEEAIAKYEQDILGKAAPAPKAGSFLNQQ